MAASPGPRPRPPDDHRLGVIGAGTGTSLRLADLLAGLSLVADLGFGLPPEQSMRSCLVATALARRLGLAEDVVADVFYTALLEHIGCSGFAHEVALRYGDEMVANEAAARTNAADPRDVVTTFLPAITRGHGPLGWARIVLSEIAGGDAAGRGFATAACEVGRATARRLGLSDGVQRGVHEVYEQWNGKGAAQGLRGEAIALPARFTQVAATAALFDHIGGQDHAVRAVQRRKGTVLDPTIVDGFVALADVVLAETAVDDVAGVLLAVEPEPAVGVEVTDLSGVAEAFGDIADLKSPYFHGHSSGVAGLARRAGRSLGLDDPSVEGLRVAASLHDLGRVGASDAAWERRGPLTGGHWEQVRLHAYHSERILGRSVALRPLAELAGLHHERLDGSGYHRGARARDIPLPARILAAADVYQALTEVRPHRPAHGADEAAAIVRDEVRAGRLDGDAVEAVLAGVGQRAGMRRVPQPAGLSEREIDVLRALADGLSNRAIAERLAISPRTAEHHVQHIYDKIGVSSRAAAALFAMEHDLLDR